MTSSLNSTAVAYKENRFDHPVYHLCPSHRIEGKMDSQAKLSILCAFFLSGTCVLSTNWFVPQDWPPRRWPSVARSDRYHHQDAYGNYKFRHELRERDGHQFREESGNEYGRVIGSYGLAESDGRQRTVYYIADKDGFRAHVRTNELGTSDVDPASVEFSRATNFVVPYPPIPSPAPEPAPSTPRKSVEVSTPSPIATTTLEPTNDQFPSGENPEPTVIKESVQPKFAMYRLVRVRPVASKGKAHSHVYKRLYVPTRKENSRRKFKSQEQKTAAPAPSTYGEYVFPETDKIHFKTHTYYTEIPDEYNSDSIRYKTFLPSQKTVWKTTDPAASDTGFVKWYEPAFHGKTISYGYSIKH